MKVFAAFLFALLLALQYRLWLSDDGMHALNSLQAAVKAQRDENDKLQSRNNDLVGEVKDLKEGNAAVEERARFELGMIGNGETFFQVIDQDGRATAEPVTQGGAAAPLRTAH